MTRPRVVLPNSRIGDWHRQKELIRVCRGSSYQCPNCFQRLRLFCFIQILAPKYLKHLSTPFRRCALRPSMPRYQLLVLDQNPNHGRGVQYNVKDPITLSANSEEFVFRKGTRICRARRQKTVFLCLWARRTRLSKCRLFLKSSARRTFVRIKGLRKGEEHLLS